MREDPHTKYSSRSVACECGHMKKHHKGYYGYGRCGFIKCKCEEYDPIDWITEFCIIPEKM